MAATEAIPVFDHDFDGFLHFLNDDTAPTSISPKRYGQVLRLDMQTLAAKAHVHRNTITRAPETEGIQRYLRESLRVIRAAVDVAGSVEKAIFWFKNNPIPTFNYKTAQDLVSEGRTDDLIRYAQSLRAGFNG
jgi:hypothetical protein